MKTSGYGLIAWNLIPAEKNMQNPWKVLKVKIGRGSRTVSLAEIIKITFQAKSC